MFWPTYLIPHALQILSIKMHCVVYVQVAVESTTKTFNTSYISSLPLPTPLSNKHARIHTFFFLPPAPICARMNLKKVKKVMMSTSARPTMAEMYEAQATKKSGRCSLVSSISAVSSPTTAV